MARRERPQATLRLLELPVEPDPIPAAGLVPGDDDVYEPLKEILLLGLGRPPRVLQRLVCGEVLAPPREVEPAFQVSRDRP
jgi:hypothetical protein